MDKKNKKSAFSFAEVMITLVIIGIVSMLVIPNLLDNSTNRVNETAANKAKYDISQAALRLQAECPRLRCNDADVRLNALLPSDGQIKYIIARDGNSFYIFTDVDEDKNMDTAYTIDNAGLVTDKCSAKDYIDGKTCNDNDVNGYTLDFDKNEAKKSGS